MGTKFSKLSCVSMKIRSDHTHRDHENGFWARRNRGRSGSTDSPASDPNIELPPRRLRRIWDASHRPAINTSISNRASRQSSTYRELYRDYYNGLPTPPLSGFTHSSYNSDVVPALTRSATPEADVPVAYRDSDGMQEEAGQEPHVQAATPATSDISCASTAVEDDFESLTESESASSSVEDEDHE
ncbi:hypothetical protein MFIFM68171_06509 [Madurella fahalii]|uniref:Uncharacterized protein n=1 Tax=Madurella fahalii TaxID=1157608 RepID=A0ABQ0GEW1_9PEZI